MYAQPLAIIQIQPGGDVRSKTDYTNSYGPSSSGGIHAAIVANRSSSSCESSRLYNSGSGARQTVKVWLVGKAGRTRSPSAAPLLVVCWKVEVTPCLSGQNCPCRLGFRASALALEVVHCHITGNRVTWAQKLDSLAIKILTEVTRCRHLEVQKVLRHRCAFPLQTQIRILTEATSFICT